MRWLPLIILALGLGLAHAIVKRPQTVTITNNGPHQVRVMAKDVDGRDNGSAVLEPGDHATLVVSATETLVVDRP